MRISDWSSDVCSSDLQSFGDIARGAQAAIGDDRHIQFRCRLDAVEDGGELRHADPGNDARRADRSGTDADLHPVGAAVDQRPGRLAGRSEEHTSELQSLMRISYAVFCLKNKTPVTNTHT